MTKAELKQLKAATEKLTKWDSSGKAFGHFNVIKSKATEKKGADKVYEFFCLMKLLADLLINYDIKIVGGTKSGKVFPEAPANKQGWPLFEIIKKTDPSNKFQICYGTNIKLSLAPKTTIAPDISIQKHDSTDDPDESMVEMILDAKFKFTSTSALPIEQIHAFIQRVNALQTSGADSIPLAFNRLMMIKSNCLLTNGKALSDQHDYCVLNKIKQVENFDSIGSIFNVVG